eukprot:m.121485 g.121485  ORF g.121485 m.121485 type:complete len:81 (-) comp12921_c7_seq22:1616-1858(-)
MDYEKELESVVQTKSQQAQFIQVSLELTDKCWEKCVTKIGNNPISESGDTKTAGCITNCVKNFLQMQQVLVAKFSGGHNQ